MKKPLIVTSPHERYPKAELATLIGALHALYVPIEVPTLSLLSSNKQC